MTESPAPGAVASRLCAPAGEAVVFDNAGFVVAPGSMFPAQNPEVCTVAELSSVDCLVLHGDPGIGKSTVLAGEQRRLTEEGKEILLLDLADIADVNDLTTQLVASEAWARWRDDSSHLILILDTLDNALLRIPTIRRTLVREFGRVDTSRLQLRIACRGALAGDAHRRSHTSVDLTAVASLPPPPATRRCRARCRRGSGRRP